MTPATTTPVHVDIDLTTPTPPPIHHIASGTRHADIDLTATPPLICCAVSSHTSILAPDHTSHVLDGMVVDLTHEDKVIYDLTEIE
jgi:hypothetical protein